ncbi:MAG: hypothetical protein U0903_18260 [Planctomycetales bacterium]
MSAFGFLEPPESKSAVMTELLEAIETPDHTTSQEYAALAISRIFEDVFQGVYSETISELPETARSQLFAMAALNQPLHYSSDVTYILENTFPSSTFF